MVASKKKQLEALGIRAKAPFSIERLILQYKSEGATAYQIAESPKSRFKIIGTTRRRVNKIFEHADKINAILKNVDQIDDASYDTPEEDRLPTTQINERTRSEAFRELASLAPRDLFTYESLSKLYPKHVTSEDSIDRLSTLEKDDYDEPSALEVLVRYDHLILQLINHEKIVTKLENDKVVDRSNHLPYFKGIDSLFEILIETYFRTISTKAPYQTMQVAVTLYLTGINKSNIHLKIAGENMIRYSIWESAENLGTFYYSLRGLHTTTNQWKRFVKSISKHLGDPEFNLDTYDQALIEDEDLDDLEEIEEED